MEENYIKKGEKGLKNASFWAINSKKFRGGGGNDQNAQYISMKEKKTYYIHLLIAGGENVHCVVGP